MRARLFLTVGLIGLVTACRSQTAIRTDAEWFADITDRVGVRFTHQAGGGAHHMPQSIGSGAALFDFDNDGRLDVYLVQNDAHATNVLYHQEADGRFRDVSAGSGLDVAGYGMGVAIGDINNDGWPDLLLTEYRGLRLFINKHDGTFEDVTKAAGLQSTEWGTSAAFFDYDRDGLLDLVVADYVNYTGIVCGPKDKLEFCDPNRFDGGITRLFHNLGSRKGSAGLAVPRFDDVTTRAGL